MLCSNGRITSLNLYNQSLSGPFPTSLLNLTGLYNLKLSANQLSGTVPASLAQLTGLTDLYLGNNPALSGKLPALNFPQYTSCCALAGDNFTPGAASCIGGGPGCGIQPPPTCH